MTEPARHLYAVNPETGEVLTGGCPECEARDEKIVGLDTTIHSQAGMIGRLKRQLEESDPTSHPLRKQIYELIDRWRLATDHKRARYSKDRFDVIRARLKDGYSISEIELAIDGLAAFPYRHYGDRLANGTKAQRDDQLSVALGSGEAVEKFANLGHQARKAGWTPEEGWPE